MLEQVIWCSRHKQTYVRRPDRPKDSALVCLRCVEEARTTVQALPDLGRNGRPRTEVAERRKLRERGHTAPENVADSTIDACKLATSKA